jgi:hypothetical protein
MGCKTKIEAQKCKYHSVDFAPFWNVLWSHPNWPSRDNVLLYVMMTRAWRITYFSIILIHPRKYQNNDLSIDILIEAFDLQINENIVILCEKWKVFYAFCASIIQEIIVFNDSFHLFFSSQSYLVLEIILWIRVLHGYKSLYADPNR